MSVDVAVVMEDFADRQNLTLVFLDGCFFQHRRSGVIRRIGIIRCSGVIGRSILDISYGFMGDLLLRCGYLLAL